MKNNNLVLKGLFGQVCSKVIHSKAGDRFVFFKKDNIVLSGCFFNFRLLCWRFCELTVELQVHAAGSLVAGVHNMHTIVYSQQMCCKQLFQLRCRTVNPRGNTFSRLSFHFLFVRVAGYRYKMLVRK